MLRNRSVRLNRRVLRVAALSISIAWSADPARAGDGVYVCSSGRHARMIESPNEVAVFFREGVDQQQIGDQKRSLSQRGIGELRAWPNTRDGHVRIMTVSDSPLKARSLPARNPNIVETRPIYYFEGESEPVMSSGTLVFKLTPTADRAALAALVEAYRLVDVEPVEGLDRVYIARPRDDAVVAAIDVAAELAEDDGTVWSQPNLIRTLETRQLNSGVEDPFFSEQWHLGIIQAPQAWAISRGQDVLFGMFDDSVDDEHEDMSNSYTGTGQDASLPSNSPDFNNPLPKKIGDRHGTAVMGLAVANANNVGGRGVAYLSRFTASRGLTDMVTDAQIASAYTFARQQKVDVHINSWGATGPNSAIIVNAIKTAFEEGRDLDGDGGNSPLGMVVVFATGNGAGDGIGDENVADNDYSSLPWVVGVGASNKLDQRTQYSNFGEFINVLAPGGDGNGLITTTDNDDAAGFPEPGFATIGNPQLDSGGRYTDSFSGTSASCPIAAGVASLILAANRNLTATDVRLILEHTTDPIEPDVAEYDGLTSRSRTHGYGRINALKAATAALESVDNGRRTWPERVARPRIEGDQIVFDQNFGTTEFLVVESDADFEFIPDDTACYDCDQTGCSIPGQTCTADDVDPLPAGVNVLFVGCKAQEDEACASGRTHNVDFAPSSGTKHFGIFARNAVGRYSFGVALDSDGNARDAGPEIFDSGSRMPGDNGNTGPAEEPLSLIINARCAGSTGCLGLLVGLSPMTVSFDGNATSQFPIDSTQTAWDFDINDAVQVNTRQRNAQFTYEVPPGETKIFTARLTMVDTRGVAGTAEVNIEVRGGEQVGEVIDGSVRILVEIQGFSGSDQDRGTAPFDVILRIDSTNITGTLQSVAWDLGDGSTSNSLSVPHTYINETNQTLVRVVTATITTISPSNTVDTKRVSRLITVDPGVSAPPLNVNINGTGVTGGTNSTACGSMGMLLPLFAVGGTLMFLRRRLW